MPAKINLCGQVFGRLTVIKESHKDKHRHYHWLCVCVCGTEKTINGEVLKRGECISCGCFQKERMSEFGKKTKHGGSYTRLYKIYKGIKNRCTNINDPVYKKYGALGIDLCSEWDTFEAFRDWSIGAGYNDKLTIDRLDNSKGYFPENCRWTTRTVQGQNRSTCLTVEQVVEIKRLLSLGVPQKQIAEQFARAEDTIGRINRKLAWSNIK